MKDYQMFDLGDVVLQCKKTLHNVQLAYKTYGKLNAAKDNVIIYPTWYSGQHYENEWLIGFLLTSLDRYNLFEQNHLCRILVSSSLFVS